MTKTKKITKNIKVIEYIERVARLEFINEPDDDDIVKIMSGFNDNDYQTELTTFERHQQRRYASYYRYGEEETPEMTTTTIYILNIYKKVTKEVEE